MYRYDEFDHRFVRDRVAQFRSQVERRLAGSLSDDEFRPLRLMNGLYLQLHAYMLRVAIPYGTLSSGQLRKLAHIAETYDRGYGHFTTRQNIQFNWPRLRDVPDILDELADVEMHAIQTSGNCIRNITADPLAGVARDEIEDPRPVAELLRQWSSLHPEFSFLPRKFKIAVSGATHDRAAILAHDLGVRVRRNEKGEVGYEISVGGGLGRTPMVAKVLHAFVHRDLLLPYVEAVMRVYNLYGRRDNKFKARVKILVHEIGIDAMRREVEAEFARIEPQTVAADPAELERISAYFAPPRYAALPSRSRAFEKAMAGDADFARWAEVNVSGHKVPGYAVATISLKPVGGIPGDATALQMRTVADLAERHSFSEIRVTMQQNLVLPYVRQDDLFALWQQLARAGLATANAGLISDIVACPGLDYCSLATARSIPVAQLIARRFADPERQRQIGPLSIKISGCINACGHHHLGHIGILGLEKGGQESYQVTLGGDPLGGTVIGERLGPGLTAAETVDLIERLVGIYLADRQLGETFAEAHGRLGHAHFKDALHAAH
ncbi:MAG: nitrite/sulfite reductase [Alphaproteobacteria bacterium]